MSTTSQITIAGTFTGGATIPSTAPIAMIAPVFALGMPHLIMMGATSAPAEIADANDDPVTIAGNMMMNMKHTSNADGTVRNAFTNTTLRYSSAPLTCMTPMKIIAVVITKIVSKYPNVPSTKYLRSNGVCENIADTTAPMTAEIIRHNPEGNLAHSNNAMKEPIISTKYSNSICSNIFPPNSPTLYRLGVGQRLRGNRCQ